MVVMKNRWVYRKDGGFTNLVIVVLTIMMVDVVIDAVMKELMVITEDVLVVTEEEVVVEATVEKLVMVMVIGVAAVIKTAGWLLINK